MDVRGQVRGEFQAAYRQAGWMDTGTKYDNRTVAMAGLRSFAQAGNTRLAPAFGADGGPANPAIALFRAGYEDVARTWGAVPAKEEGLL